MNVRATSGRDLNRGPRYDEGIPPQFDHMHARTHLREDVIRTDGAVVDAVQYEMALLFDAMNS